MRKLSTLWLSALVLTAPLSFSFGQDAAKPKASEDKPLEDSTITRKAAIEEGVQLLLSYQERYQSDRPVGSLPDDELKDWQEKEVKRLMKVRKASKRPAQEWPYEGVYRVRPNGAIPSGYRVGGTAIVCEALIKAPGYKQDKTRQAAVERGLNFVLGRIKSDKTLSPGPKEGYDVRGWAHAYGMNLMLLMRKEGLVPKKQSKKVDESIKHLIHCLQVNALGDGGWNYASDRANACSPFMTGPTLLFLFEAKAQGFEIPTDLIEKALTALEKGRSTKTGAYGYAGPRREKMAASSGRAAIAELALLRAGRSDTDRLRTAVLGFFDNWEHLFDRKSKQGTHEGPYSIAPYYFFYAHNYAALAIESLPEKERPDFRVQLEQLLWRTRQANGAWNDRIFPRTESYCTAMSLLALMAPDLPQPTGWTSEKPTSK
ncbi:MAG: hypothetical protein ACI87O_001192 [Planctomycetota bacterium]|jgi:hypothetical protein